MVVAILNYGGLVDDVTLHTSKASADAWLARRMSLPGGVSFQDYIDFRNRLNSGELEDPEWPDWWDDHYEDSCIREVELPEDSR